MADNELRIATWNVNGLDATHLDLRSEAACLTLLLRGKLPHVVLLQEVVRRSFFAHFRPHLLHAGFTLFPEAPVSDSEYFCVLASRLPVLESWRRPFPGSAMGRALLGARLGAGLDAGLDDAAQPDLLVTTAHLESLKAGSAERVAQLEQALRLIADHPGPAVFAGDTNLRDAEVPRAPSAAEVDDAWIAAGSPRAADHTWTPPNSPRPRMRFDRAYMNRRPGWRAAAVVAFGKDPVEGAGGLTPSDHFGLEVTFEVG